MKDFIPKGTGNSRYLKSVSDFMTRYPTYADFCSALVAGTLPIDLNGVNSGGYTQLGTALNKANLLSDTTAWKYKEVTPQLKDISDGTIVYVNENGSPVEYYVATHDYESELNGNGRVLLVRKDVAQYGTFGTGALGLDRFLQSNIYDWMQNTFPQRLDDEVRNASGATTIRYYIVTGYSETSSASTTSMKAFPLSSYEIGLSTGANDGSSALPTAGILRVATTSSGASSTWWTRAQTQSNPVYVTAAGVTDDSRAATTSNGYRPAFTLPETMYYYNDSLYVDDPQPIDVSDVVPDEIFSILSGALLYDGEKTTDVLGNLAGVQIETDWYAGTGTYGSSNPTVISFGFTPRVVICYKIVSWSKTITNIIGGEAPPNYWGCNPSRMPDNKYIADIGIGSIGNSSVYAKYVFATNKMYLYNEYDASSQLNASGKIYYWLAIK